ncbi:MULTISPECIES: YciI family protein [unclassified Nocardioides]|uniref:YciI family protein n=1 Tax=unclassified Nocardioides TaxID=2615069 RepID=UPI0036187821
MTQYLLAVNGSAADEDAQSRMTMEEIQPLYDAVNTFNEKLRAEGAWVFAGGLLPIGSTTTVDNTGAETVITDGPYVESKEWLGGFWVIEAPDLDAALKWAAEGSKACAGRVEVRPFQDEPEA